MKIIYMANDGKNFDSMNDCIEYEKQVTPIPEGISLFNREGEEVLITSNSNKRAFNLLMERSLEDGGIKYMSIKTKEAAAFVNECITEEIYIGEWVRDYNCGWELIDFRIMMHEEKIDILKEMKEIMEKTG